MTKINDPANMESDWFAMNLAYADGQNPQYNGNIASMTWKSVKYDNPHHYDFTYDGADRLTGANYEGQRDYRMSINEYDKNGNIKELSRYGRLGESSDYSWIDALDYTYKGNQLQSVDDYTGVDFQNNGYSDHGSFDNDEYLYDANGNMIEDENKQIGNVEYTYNNRPERIIMTQDRENIINYAYDATGNKLAKRPSSSRARGLRTDYVGNFVYKDNELAYILTDQGRVVPRNGSFEYQYFIKDHLGNTRIVFNDAGEILQDNSYYPFGMLERSGNPDASGKMDGLDYSAGMDPDNKYLYNGKELQDDFGLDWYDYGARMYDAQLGRWHVEDPMAEERQSISPYNYVQNNPVARIDPTGMLDDEYSVDEEGNVEHEKDTDEDYDRLHTKENYEKGNMDEGVRVDDQKILADLSMVKEKQNVYDAIGTLIETRKLRYASSNNNNDVAKLFTFLAKNTGVEWTAYSHNKNEATLGTYQDDDLGPGPGTLNIDKNNIRAHIGSHPNPSTLKSEVNSLAGDRELAKKQFSFKYFVFMAKSSNLYYLKQNDKIKRQKNIDESLIKKILE
ncbi:MAG: hypothetical protein K9I74_11880 [Bacteroidales bacterium]|nr:hypothetical protein [Bacteroidales bacterium]